MKDPLFIHKATLTPIGQITWDRPEMYQDKINSLKREYPVKLDITIELESPIPTSQRGYYFGGIIRSECMNHSDFAGWSEKEIHYYLLEVVTGYHKTIRTKDGKETVVFCHDDFSSYNTKDMTQYLEKVLDYLAINHEVFPKNPDEYLLRKYSMNK